MVKKNYIKNPKRIVISEDAIVIIQNYFKLNLSKFMLISKNHNGPFWCIKFSNDEVKIKIEGDAGFTAKIIIEETEYPLWQFNREVGNKTETNYENILFILDILKDFFN